MPLLLKATIALKRHLLQPHVATDSSNNARRERTTTTLNFHSRIFTIYARRGKSMTDCSRSVNQSLFYFETPSEQHLEK